MLYIFADTPAQTLEEVLTLLKDQRDRQLLTVRSHREVWEAGGSIPGRMSGVRKKDVEREESVLGGMNWFIVTLENATVEPTSHPFNKLGKAPS